MILIYDFDGTLTPFGAPRFPILNKCGSISEFYERLFKRNPVQDFWPTLKEYIEEKGYEYNLTNLCYNADKILLNPGVLEFLSYFHQNNHQQIVISLSCEEYLRNTLIAPFCDAIYGTIVDGVNARIMKSEDKIAIIKDIINEQNIDGREIVYFGDGLTDKEAFSYIKSIGGTSIFVYDSENENLKEDLSNVITTAFPKDFSLSGDLFLYIKNLSKGGR